MTKKYESIHEAVTFTPDQEKHLMLLVGRFLTFDEVDDEFIDLRQSVGELLPKLEDLKGSIEAWEEREEQGKPRDMMAMKAQIALLATIGKNQDIHQRVQKEMTKTMVLIREIVTEANPEFLCMELAVKLEEIAEDTTGVMLGYTGESKVANDGCDCPMCNRLRKEAQIKEEQPHVTH